MGLLKTSFSDLREIAGFILGTCVLIGLGTNPVSADEAIKLSVEHGEFVLLVSPSQEFRSEDFVGATLQLQIGTSLQNVKLERIEKITTAHGSPVVLHQLAVETGSGDFVNLCKPNQNGLSLGIPMRDKSGVISFACASGAIAKCILWGYPPWPASRENIPSEALYRACVHMVRADYAGTGDTATEAGVIISFCDRFGVVPCDTNQSWTFEAIWDENGAQCIAQLRRPHLTSPEILAEFSSKRRGKVANEDCMEGQFGEDGLLTSYYQDG